MAILESKAMSLMYRPSMCSSRQGFKAVRAFYCISNRFW